MTAPPASSASGKPESSAADTEEAPLGGPGAAAERCPVCPEMVSIPAGSFMMGSAADEQGRYGNEGPRHVVHIRAFAVSAYPITRGEWRTYVVETGKTSTHQSCTWDKPGLPQDDRHPVVCVSAQDAQDYASWLSTKSGQHYRLLTEAEHEYANRAGSQTRYFWGDSVDKLRRYASMNGHGTMPVGSYEPNAFGLYDSTGNVWSWTQDCYHPSFNGAPVDGSAWGAYVDCDRVVRGGSWANDASALRSAARGDSGDGHYDGIGFRLARAADAQPVEAAQPAPQVRKTAPPASAASRKPDSSTAVAAQAPLARPRAPRAGPCPVCPEMVDIPAGDFLMGSPPDDEDSIGAEVPQHLVHIRAFAASVYPVTRGEWRKYVSETGNASHSRTCSWDRPGYPQNDRHPVVCVTWQDAQDYARWLSTKSGQHYRLLTEAEHEYANRAGSQTRYFWGDCVDKLRRYANMNGHGTTPVGSFEPNAFGLYDSTGNVWSWTEDRWHPNYDGAPADGSAWDADKGSDGAVHPVLRGGSWGSSFTPGLRSASRVESVDGDGDAFVGFRLASDPSHE